MKLRKIFTLLFTTLMIVMIPFSAYAEDLDGDGYNDEQPTPWDEFAELEGRTEAASELPLLTVCVYTYGLTPTTNAEAYDSLNNMFLEMLNNYFSLYFAVQNVESGQTYEFDILAESNYQKYVDLPIGTYNIMDFGVYFRGTGVAPTTFGTNYCKTTSFEITGNYTEVEITIDIVGIWKNNADISDITARVASEGHAIFQYVYNQNGEVQVETEAPGHAISETLIAESQPAKESETNTTKATEYDNTNNKSTAEEDSKSPLHQTFPEWLGNNIFTIILLVALVVFYIVYRKKNNKKMHMDN